MNALLRFGLPFLLVLGLILGLTSWWTTAGGPRGEPTPIDWEGPFELGQHVRLSGLAHYGATVTLNTPATLFDEARQHFVFGLFPAHDAAGREIRVLVRTERPPERLVSYEVMTIDGVVAPPIPETVPANVQTLMSESAGYWFADDVVVVEPVRIESDGEVWTPTP